MRREGQRGQAVVEFAVVTAIALPLLLGAADVALAYGHSLVMRDAADTIAHEPAALDYELARLSMDCTSTITESDGVRVVHLECVNPLPLSSLIVELSAEASAPMGGS